MEGKKLEGDMKGFCKLFQTIMEICIFFLVLFVVLLCVKMIDFKTDPYPQAFAILCFGFLFSLYSLLYSKKYHYTITETEITVVSLFGTKVLPIENGLTYSQKPINPSWHLITVNCNNQKINIRTKTEKEVLEFLAEYGTEVD